MELFEVVFREVPGAFAGMVQGLGAVAGLLVAGMMPPPGDGSRRAAGMAPGNAAPPGSGSRRKIARRIVIAATVFFLLGIIAVAGAQWLFFEDILRWAMRRAESRSGVRIAYAEASGSLLGGRLTLQGVTIVNDQSPLNRFDLRIEECRIDAPLPGLMASPRRVRSISVAGIDGEFQRLKQPGQTRKDGRAVVIGRIEVARVGLVVSDASKEREVRFPVTVDRFEAAELRSDTVLSQVLFGSNLSGSIDGAPFEISNERVGSGRKTRWDASNIPAPFLGQVIGGVFRYFDGGTVDVLVRDEEGTTPAGGSDMAWRITVRDFEAAPPTPPVFTAVTDRLVVGWLDQHRSEVDFSFNVVLNKEEFTTSASSDASALWDKVLDGFSLEIAQRAGVQPEKVRDTINTGGEAIRNFLDRRRSPGSSPGP